MRPDAERAAVLAVHPVLAYLRALRALDDTELQQLRQTVPDLAGAADLLELAETAADHGQVQQRLRTAPALAVDAVRQIVAGDDPSRAGAQAARVRLLAADRSGTLELLPDVAQIFEMEDDRRRPPAALAIAVAATPLEALVLMQRLVVRALGTPLAVIGDGRLAMTEASAFAALTEADPGLVRSLTGLLDRAGLLLHGPDGLRADDAARSWLADDRVVERWSGIVAESLPSGPLEGLVREWSGGTFAELARAAGAAWPLGTDWLDPSLQALAQDWAALGVIDGAGTMTPAGQDVLQGRRPRIEWPQPARTVYLQGDLRVIVPGVSPPEQAEFLARVARPISLAQAETYEMSATSVASAHASGLGAAEMLTGLAEISPTGLPQPMRYLIEDTVSSMERITVVATPKGTLIRCDTPALAETLSVDRDLRRLALVRHGSTELTTRRPPATVLSTLAAARYPATRADAERPSLAPAAPPPAEQAAAPPDVSELTRPLDRQRAVTWAIKHHAAVDVQVAMPGGDVQTLTLYPRSLSHNRLRAADADTETERTLPLTAVGALRIEGDQWDR